MTGEEVFCRPGFRCVTDVVCGCMERGERVLSPGVVLWVYSRRLYVFRYFDLNRLTDN